MSTRERAATHEQLADRGFDLALANRILAQMSESSEHVETPRCQLDAGAHDASLEPLPVTGLAFALLLRALELIVGALVEHSRPSCLRARPCDLAFVFEKFLR